MATKEPYNPSEVEISAEMKQYGTTRDASIGSLLTRAEQTTKAPKTPAIAPAVIEPVKPPVSTPTQPVASPTQPQATPATPVSSIQPTAATNQSKVVATSPVRPAVTPATNYTPVAQPNYSPAVPASPANPAQPAAPVAPATQTQAGSATATPTPTPNQYSVVSGDNLTKIAQRFGVTVADILRSNPDLANPNLIYPGQRLNLPSGTGAPAAFSVPQGYERINGQEFSTRELQQANFADIQTSPDGGFLYGKRVDPAESINSMAQGTFDMLERAGALSSSTERASVRAENLDKEIDKITGDNNQVADVLATPDKVRASDGSEISLKEPTTVELYNQYMNTPEISSLSQRAGDLQQQLDELDALELSFAEDIRKETDGEASEAYIVAKATERAKDIYPKKLAIQAEMRNIVGQLNGAKENAANILQFTLQDREIKRQEQTRQEEVKRAETQRVEDLALKALEFGASPEAIAQILEAGDFSTATQIASKFIKQPQEMLSVEDAKKLGVPYGTTVAEAMARNITPSDEQELLGGLSEQQISIMQNIQNQVRQDQDVKDFMVARDAYNRIQATKDGMKEDGRLTPAGDVSMLFSFMKLLDPGSVVREGEFATAQNTAGIADRLRNMYNNALTGNRLSADQVKEYSAEAEAIYRQKLATHQDAVQFYTNQADMFGIPQELIIRDFTGGAATGVQSEYEPQPLPPLNQSYATLDALFLDHPEYRSVVQQVAAETGLNDTEILKMLSQGDFNSAPSTALNGSQELGQLSSQFESNGDPAIIGWDQVGGTSYGTYQMIPTNAQKFVTQDPFLSSFFAGQQAGTEQFNQTWKTVATKHPEQFERAQHDYIAKTHYDPQIAYLKQNGVDVSKFSPTLQDVIWSTAVQHGPQTDVVLKAMKRAGKNASEQDIINAIYDERWSNGARFVSSTDEVKNGVKKRFDAERKLALNRLSSNRNTA